MTSQKPRESGPRRVKGAMGYHDFNHISFELDANLASTVCAPFHESITWSSSSPGDFFAFSLPFCIPPKSFREEATAVWLLQLQLPSKNVYILFSIQFNNFAIQIPCAAFRFFSVSREQRAW